VTLTPRLFTEVCVDDPNLLPMGVFRILTEQVLEEQWEEAWSMLMDRLRTETRDGTLEGVEAEFMMPATFERFMAYGRG